MITLHANEKIELIIRKHWFVIIQHIIAFIIILVAPAAVLFIIPLILAQLNIDPNAVGPFIDFLLSLYILIPLGYLFLMWTDYYLDLWIITNERIIDIEQRGLFNREISEIPLHRVQDVTLEIQGPVETLLDFGTIKVQTAGEQHFEIRFVPHLYEAKEIILKFANEFRIPGSKS